MRGDRMSGRKKLLFFALMVSLPVLFPVALVLGYYTYQKLASPIRVTGTFGELDAELGWRLKPRSRVRLWRENRLGGSPLFDTMVYTNADGFRVARPDVPSQSGAVVAIGDSWTFGYAVDYEDSFPAQLAAALARPVVNLGVPAYGSAQALLLLERHIGDLQPALVVHLNLGLWRRSLCHGQEQPSAILKPCFWWNAERGEIELLTPPPGRVEEMARLGVYPGGWLTAGNESWRYYLVSRPLIRLQQVLIAAGLMSGHRSEYDDDQFVGPRATHYTLARIARLARRHGFVFLLIDPDGDYAAAHDALRANFAEELDYLDADAWRDAVATLAERLPDTEIHVPGDRHFAGGMNRLIAQAVAQRAAALRLTGRERPASAPR